MFYLISYPLKCLFYFYHLLYLPRIGFAREWCMTEGDEVDDEVQTGTPSVVRNIRLSQYSEDEEVLDINVEAHERVGGKRKNAKVKKPFVWKDNMLFDLINLWKQEAGLYNVKDPLYSLSPIPDKSIEQTFFLL